MSSSTSTTAEVKKSRLKPKKSNLNDENKKSADFADLGKNENLESPKILENQKKSENHSTLMCMYAYFMTHTIQNNIYLFDRTPYP